MISVSLKLNDLSPPLLFDTLNEALAKCFELSSSNPTDEPKTFFIEWIDKNENDPDHKPIN